MTTNTNRNTNANDDTPTSNDNKEQVVKWKLPHEAYKEWQRLTNSYSKSAMAMSINSLTGFNYPALKSFIFSSDQSEVELINLVKALNGHLEVVKQEDTKYHYFLITGSIDNTTQFQLAKNNNTNELFVINTDNLKDDYTVDLTREEVLKAGWDLNDFTEVIPPLEYFKGYYTIDTESEPDKPSSIIPYTNLTKSWFEEV